MNTDKIPFDRRFRFFYCCSMISTDYIEIRGPTLREIAHVRPGYLSRSSVQSSPTGTHRLLQAKDVSAESGVRLDDAIRFHPERKPELYQVSQGDILIAARGQDHHAHLIVEDPADTLASSVFYIIRPHPERVRPGYLAWWLNQPQVQARIDTATHGTGIGYIGRRALEQLTVPLPEPAVQARIERIIALWQTRKTLQAQLDAKREQFIHASCRQAVRQPRNPLS